MGHSILIRELYFALLDFAFKPQLIQLVSLKSDDFLLLKFFTTLLAVLGITFVDTLLTEEVFTYSTAYRLKTHHHAYLADKMLVNLAYDLVWVYFN